MPYRAPVNGLVTDGDGIVIEMTIPRGHSPPSPFMRGGAWL